MNRTRCLMVLVSVALAVTATSFSQNTPIMQVFDLDVAPLGQFPLSCLAELATGGSVSEGCEAIEAEGNCRIQGSGGCRATMKLAVDVDNPEDAPLGGVCYSVELTADVTLRRGATRRLEQVGHWCFTEHGNSIQASGACFSERGDRRILQAVGELKGAIYNVDGTTTIRAIHNESIPIFSGSSGKWGGGTWFGGFRIPNLVPRSLVNIVGCSSRGRGNCGKLRATSNWASKPAIRSFPSAVRTVEKQLRALASSPPELLVFPRFA